MPAPSDGTNLFRLAAEREGGLWAPGDTGTDKAAQERAKQRKCNVSPALAGLRAWGAGSN